MIISSGALFYSLKTNRFLFVQRFGAKHQGTWASVGGKKEIHETNLNGLNREIIEELGFLPNIIKYIPIETFTSHDQHFEYNTYICVVQNEFIPILNHENLGYCWTDLNYYPKPLHPGLYETLKLDVIQEKIKLLKEIIS
jgi:8-oxo-dGTP pyrophosphatase MutT (NUDIX family)